jgi:hypothetical protein
LVAAAGSEYLEHRICGCALEQRKIQETDTFDATGGGTFAGRRGCGLFTLHYDTGAPLPAEILPVWKEA